MQIPGLNLLNGTSVPFAEKNLSSLNPENDVTRTSPTDVLENTETSADDHYTSGNGEPPGNIPKIAEAATHGSSVQETVEEEKFEVGNLVADPLDMALAASSDHSSAESDAGEEHDSDDDDRYRTFWTAA